MRPQLLTRNDLLCTIGEVDDLTAAEILSIGATKSELEAAMRLVDREAAAPVPERSSRHLSSLVQVLRELAELNEPEYLGTD